MHTLAEQSEAEPSLSVEPSRASKSSESSESNESSESSESSESNESSRASQVESSDDESRFSCGARQAHGERAKRGCSGLRRRGAHLASAEMVAPVQTSLMTSRRLWTCDCSWHGVTVLRVAPSRSRVLAAGQARVGAERRASSQARVEQAGGRRYLSGAEERFQLDRERDHTPSLEKIERERESAAGGRQKCGYPISERSWDYM